jgi:hypothetical protein
MKRHWSARLFGASLALWFGLAMVGPEVHQCPLHDVAAATSHAGHAGHAATPPDAPGAPAGRHQHCTCPQACCPVGVGVAMPAPLLRWTVAAVRVIDAIAALHRAALPGSPAHFLPFALAPPRALA